MSEINCVVCKIPKQLEEFYVSGKYIQRECKACQSKKKEGQYLAKLLNKGKTCARCKIHKPIASFEKLEKKYRKVCIECYFPAYKKIKPPKEQKEKSNLFFEKKDFHFEHALTSAINKSKAILREAPDDYTSNVVLYNNHSIKIYLDYFGEVNNDSLRYYYDNVESNKIIKQIRFRKKHISNLDGDFITDRVVNAFLLAIP